MQPTEQAPLQILYEGLNAGKSPQELELYHSDIHYVREAVYRATGEWLTLRQTYAYLIDEGLLEDSGRYGPRNFGDPKELLKEFH